MKTEQSPPLDALDRKLLSLLAKDNSGTYAEMGKKLHLSAPAIFERIKRYKKWGWIGDSVFILDGNKLGKPFLCFVQVFTHTIQRTRHLATLAAIPDVLEIHSTTGNSGVMLKIRTRDSQALEDILAQIHALEGVTGTHTQMVLSTLLERGVSLEE
jgi:Lrp/AsnC family transcriptional regulator, leucine-responsive regulatory protein